MRLTIIPFESVAGDLPRAVARRLRGILPWKFVVSVTVPDPERSEPQGLIDIELFRVRIPHSERHDEMAVGLTAGDVTAAEFGSVFGYAIPESRVAIVSIFHLAEGTQGRRGGRRLLVERTTKEVLHEAGHLMGLSHCSHPGCVMQYSQTLHDTDLKQSRFCPDCLRELSRLPEPATEQ
ncbi:MAG: hypothetical protein JXA58_04950 [Dehalococcoidia bacterium]|nr:hypothetical protein [Dehalococcoidia bacterium]